VPHDPAAFVPLIAIKGVIMRAAAGFLAVLCIGALSQALAMEPPSSPAPQAAPESAASTQADRASAGPATTASDSAAKNVSLKAGDEDAAAQLKRFRAAGYKPELHNGEILFCRNETVLGSRFDKKICNTVDQLEHIEADAREATRKVQSRISGDPRTRNP
jgi:hypothetical protein